MSGSVGCCAGKDSRLSGCEPGRRRTIPRSTVKKRIRTLYRRCPPHSAVVCFDEWGPLDLKPVGGLAWARQKQRRRMRATYRRLKGTEQFLGFYDVHADCPACFVVARPSWTSAKRFVACVVAIRESGFS